MIPRLLIGMDAEMSLDLDMQYCIDPIDCALCQKGFAVRTDQDERTPYAGLSPDLTLDALESAGFRADGGLTALNSYENRVFQVGIDEGDPVVAKFYRPGRWSSEAILEEHAFTLELAELELPCIAPLQRDGRTLFEHQGFRFAVFPRQAGRAPDIEAPGVLAIIGRALGRLHAAGAVRPFAHRAALTAQRFGVDAMRFLLDGDFIPLEMTAAYEAVAGQLLDRIEPFMDSVAVTQRIHGDCHLGNVLWRHEAPNIVDFDDTLMGPPIQDLWMLLSGERSERTAQLDKLAKAYDAFHPFDPRETRLIESLRTLRLMRHAAWIGRRWSDPAFPLAFPWFDTPRYWSEHILSLKEQLAALDEPPLTL
ncbi:MAG: serine/threonine protein kinase [Gammaproteobacteria bacterium]|nr:serine/threonine protein kinase [Gammaproteobacteria bacterium]